VMSVLSPYGSDSQAFPIIAEYGGRAANGHGEEVSGAQESRVLPSPLDDTKPRGPRLPRSQYLLPSMWKDNCLFHIRLWNAIVGTNI
jgi:hypothetical protein